jgi:hypothetical protein
MRSLIVDPSAFAIHWPIAIGRRYQARPTVAVITSICS